MDLNNKVAIVTGASRGLGLQISRSLSKQGMSVMMAARDIDMLVASELERGQPVRCDVREPESVDYLVRQTLSSYGRVDVLVCCAGVYGPIGRLEQVNWQHWVDAINTNLLGTVLCCRAVLPAMRAQQSGKIIAISGGGASAPMPNFSAYAASKAAVVRFIETLAEETRNDHIDCNSVAPGPLYTRLTDEVIEAGPVMAGESAYARALKQREEGTSFEEVNGLVSRLVSTDGISGCLLSAIWDDWQNVLTEPLRIGSDTYKLRRLV